MAFTANEEVGEVPKPNGSWFTVFHRDTIKDICTQTIPATEIAIYPTSDTHVYERRMDKPLSQDVIDGKNVQWVHGCFGYFSPVSEKTISQKRILFRIYSRHSQWSSSLRIRALRLTGTRQTKKRAEATAHPAARMNAGAMRHGRYPK